MKYKDLNLSSVCKDVSDSLKGSEVFKKSNEIEIPSFFYSTGDGLLNKALSGDSIKGIPSPSLVEIYSMGGEENEVIVLPIIKECQDVDGLVLILDSTKTFDKVKAKKIGIDLDRCLELNPKSLEDSFSILCKLIETSLDFLPTLIVWNFPELMPSINDLEGTFEEINEKANSKVLLEGFKSILISLRDRHVCFICLTSKKENRRTNQTYTLGDKINKLFTVRLSIESHEAEYSDVKVVKNLTGNLTSSLLHLPRYHKDLLNKDFK